MAYRFETEQWLPYPTALVFAFFANPENLPRLMPRWQRARIEQATFVAPPPRPEGTPHYAAVAAGSGTRITISARPFPLAPFRAPWDALIEDFRWNEGFCDVQERGPFRYWRHCHSVMAQNDPDTLVRGTLLRDEVNYELSFGPLNGMANVVARRALASTFRYRQKRTAELLALLTSR